MDDERHEYPVTGLTWILNHRVCGPCNGGWMARNEGAIKPILLPAMRGQPIRLKPQAQRIVAAWAVKTALLFELREIDGRRQPAFAPASNFDWLYQHRDDPIPPPGTQVWMAYVDARLGTHEAHPGRHNAATSKWPQDVKFYFVTFAVGYLVFQVSGQDFREFDPDPRSLPSIQRPDSLISYVRSIWPQRDIDIDWPPLHGIRDEDFVRFASFEGSNWQRMFFVPIPHLKAGKQADLKD